GADFLLAAVADDLAERLAAVNREFATVADIATPLPLLAARIAALEAVGRVIRVDRLAETRPDVVADTQALPFGPGRLDLVVSALGLHWIDDLPGVLAQVHAALKP